MLSPHLRKGNWGAEVKPLAQGHFRCWWERSWLARKAGGVGTKGVKTARSRLEGSWSKKQWAATRIRKDSGTDPGLRRPRICSSLWKTLSSALRWHQDPEGSCGIQKKMGERPVMSSSSGPPLMLSYPSIANGLWWRQLETGWGGWAPGNLSLALIWKELAASRRGGIWELERSWRRRGGTSEAPVSRLSEEICLLASKPCLGNLRTLLRPPFLISLSVFNLFQQLLLFRVWDGSHWQLCCKRVWQTPLILPQYHCPRLPIWQNSDFVWGWSEPSLKISLHLSASLASQRADHMT